MNKADLFPKEFLSELGIVDWAYTAQEIPKSYREFDEWVNAGSHGSLKYLSDHRKELRSNIKNVFPEFKSAFVFLFDYSKEKKRSITEKNEQRLASYALGFDGLDYHHVFKEKLAKITSHLKEQAPSLKTYNSIDAQPILERDLAYRSGLGWFGKNSMLISREHGSYFLIASLLTDHDFKFEENSLEVDHCGNCTKCIEACPTDAIDVENRTLIAEKCISTFTIEHFKPVAPPENIDQSNGEIFGCDICQDVCPWNEKKLKDLLPGELSSQAQVINNFFINRELTAVIDDLESMSNRFFRKKFHGTVFERTGRVGVLKNLITLRESKS